MWSPHRFALLLSPTFIPALFSLSYVYVYLFFIQFLIILCCFKQCPAWSLWSPWTPCLFSFFSFRVCYLLYLLTKSDLHHAFYVFGCLILFLHQKIINVWFNLIHTFFVVGKIDLYGFCILDQICITFWTLSHPQLVL